MLDGKAVQRKLVGSDQERAVSPVIGVILMVAITVILAAVIAAFVLDIGPGESGVTAAVDLSGEGTDTVEIQITSMGDADGVAIVDDTGTIVDDASALMSGTGSSVTVTSTSSTSADIASQASGDYTIQAYTGSPSQNTAIDDSADQNSIIAEFNLS